MSNNNNTNTQDSSAAAPAEIAPVPTPGANKNKLPDHLQSDGKTVRTKVTSFAKVLKDKLQALSDLATMEILLPSGVRMGHRLKTIKQAGSARHLKIRGHWDTKSPQMHITNLTGRKVSNDECQVTFSVFDMDDKGNKKAYNHYSDIEVSEGVTRRKLTSVDYKIRYEITETIKSGMPIVREVMEIKCEAFK